MGIVWKSSELKESSDFKSILKLEATVESLSEGSWGEESKFGDSAYTQVNLEDVEILAMKEDIVAPPLIDDKYSYRINQSERKTSKWEAFLQAAEALGLDLPGGLEGKRFVFDTVEGGSGKGKFIVLIPVAIVEEMDAINVEAKALSLMVNSSNEKSFLRACTLDAVVSKNSALMEVIKSGEFATNNGKVW